MVYFIQDPEEELTSMKINHLKFKLKSDQCGRSECPTLPADTTYTHSCARTHIVCRTRRC